MSYSIKECVLTLQGEGAHAGRAIVLCRFTGCNLWNGDTSDRQRSHCTFCDTDFIGTDGPGGGVFETAGHLAGHLLAIWNSVQRPAAGDARVVFTGGEPLLQLDKALIDECHANGFNIAIETNGTVACPPGVDWICVSPKTPSEELKVRGGNELKIVYPQANLSPEQFGNLQFEHWFVQPLHDENLRANTLACISYCLGHPRWRLCVQLHKIVEIR